MAKWLTSFRESMSGGVVKATSAEHLQVIEAGFSHFLQRARNPQAGRVLVRGPLRNVAVVRNEQMLIMFLSMMVSEGAEKGRWGGHRFYYPCWLVPEIQSTEAWHAIQCACILNNVSARLGHNSDIWHFESTDWTLCEVLICLM